MPPVHAHQAAETDRGRDVDTCQQKLRIIGGGGQSTGDVADLYCMAFRYRVFGMNMEARFHSPMEELEQSLSPGKEGAKQRAEVEERTEQVWALLEADGEGARCEARR